MSIRTVKVAAIQAEPVWNDLNGGIAKSIALIEEAARNGVNVLGFPEVFVPGYPWSIWANSVVDNVEFMNEYFHNSLEKDSEEMRRIQAAVKEAAIFVVFGYSERCRGSLYIAQSFIDPSGTIIHHRRKIKPTHVERAYWGDGQGESLKTVVPTQFGRVGGLNCWEHTQTLLRYYEYSQDVDIHVASWPLIWDVPNDEWPYHISSEANQRFSQVMAMEGACFVLVCTQILTEKNKESTKLKDFIFAKAPGGGFSMIFGPDGKPLVEALDPGVEGILYADVDLDKKLLAKQNLDIVGHYARPDLLSLRVESDAATHVHHK